MLDDKVRVGHGDPDGGVVQTEQPGGGGIAPSFRVHLMKDEGSCLGEHMMPILDGEFPSESGFHRRPAFRQALLPGLAVNDCLRFVAHILQALSCSNIPRRGSGRRFSFRNLQARHRLCLRWP